MSISDLEKFRRAKVLDLERRQADADRAKMLREGMPVKPGTPESDADPRRPIQPQSVLDAFLKSVT